MSLKPSSAHLDAGADNSVDDSGLECLLLIAALHGIAVEAADLSHAFCGDSFNVSTILRAARQIGLKARETRPLPERLHRANLPSIAITKDGTFFIVAKFEVVTGEVRRLLVQRPNGPPQVISIEDFMSRWSGQMLLFTSRASMTQELSRFDFSWFIPSVIKYRRLLAEVMLISFALQIIGLATPLFFQVVMDKVLVNQAVSTLNVIGVGLLCVILFDACLSAIRTYVFSHTTSKLDIELGARLFRHLLALPIAYFHTRRVGDSVARVRELENIRSFLTGNALTIVIDILFSFVFLAVMLIYSKKLTLVVILSIPVYIILSIIFTPLLRRKLNEKFNRGSENQSFLVETIAGIDTVKAMAIEPRWNQQWEKQLAGYVRSCLASSNLGLLAGGAVKVVGKLVTLAIMWWGAWQVMDGAMTVGELIAFNMLASQIATPVLRLSQTWNDFQQIGISMQRLGDILNFNTEIAGHKTRLPRIVGRVEFDQVTFRYRPDGHPALRNVNFAIAPGEVIGIVGRSGSGKSTLTKLIQRFYAPESGRILIDGYDLATADTASLRRQIGVVPQDGTLFGRSIRDNIALTNPAAAMNAVVAAARLAGAHEFICDLADGYETLVGEHGVGLSGGQRQRIAIARSLLHDPSVLIFDEATSSLDYESEHAIQRNMGDICQGRTVLIVAHRLSAVRQADRIFVMDRGQIAQSGSHDELLLDPDGIYAHLHQLQHMNKDKQVSWT